MHADPDHPNLPHTVVHSIDMRKTKGPLHKTISGRSARLLMVMVVHFRGDCEMTVTANKRLAADSWYATPFFGTLSDAGFNVKDALVSAVLRDRKADKALCVLIDPRDTRYVHSHQVDFAAQYAAAAQEQDLAVRVTRRKKIEAIEARGMQLADTSVFHITVTGLLDQCDCAVLTRTIFLNDLPNPKLKKYVSASVAQNERVFEELKHTSLPSSELRVRFGRRGVSVRKFHHLLPVRYAL